MKTFYKYILLILFSLGISLTSFAQEKTDAIYLLDGNQGKGKVTAINKNNIKFIYSGETLEFNIEKSTIQKIVFSSGRTQVFNQPKTIEKVANSAERKSRIAVLPVDYITNDKSIMIDAMSSKIQNSTTSSLKKNTSILLKVQDPRTTNALLAKKGITAAQLKAISPKEIALVLGVEYVLYNTTNVVNKGTVTTGTGVTTYKNKKTKDNSRYRRNKTNNSGLAISTNSSRSRVNYDTRVSLNIYNDKGDNLFNDDKRAFGSGLDSYDSALNYLIKRTPFGTKARKR
ncbi:hypothetical protein [Tenacibaculum insulae]|uniref:hypothetical protein n=1 Tax=Tenacibaculum insulae TaxID=2029677 RepID=UPI003AB7A5F7